MGLNRTHLETSGATDDPSAEEVFDPLLLHTLLAHLIASVTGWKVGTYLCSSLWRGATGSSLPSPADISLIRTLDGGKCDEVSRRGCEKW